MSQVSILGSTEGFAGLADDLSYLVDGPAAVPVLAPKTATNPYTVTAPASGGFLDFLSTAGDFIQRAGQSTVNVMNAAGRAKAQATVQRTAVNDAYYQNFRQPLSWFDQEMLPGLKNSTLLMLAGAVGLGLVLMNRKPTPQVVNP